MKVTVVTYRRAYAGQGEPLLATASALLASARRGRQHSQDGVMLQGIQDPHAVLYVATWPDRGPFEQALALHRPDDHLQAFTAEGPRRSFFRTLSLYERLEQRAALISCRLIECRAGTCASVLRFMEEQSGPRVKQQPHLVFRRVCADLEAPDRLLVLFGWQSPAGQAAARAEVRPAPDAELERLGARVTCFEGRPRAVWDPARGYEAPRPA